MKQRFLLLLITIVSVVFTACKKEPGGKEGTEQKNVEMITFLLEDQTKVCLDPETLKMSFEEGDQILVNNDVYPVVRNEAEELVLQVPKSKDGKYNCLASGPQSYIGTTDSNYKIPNFQLYAPDSFKSEAMPMICIKDTGTEKDNVLHFRPLMGVVKIPVSAEGVSIRSIKIEDAGWAYGTAATYMSGRAIPVDSNGDEVKTVCDDIHHLTLKGGGTAIIREIVLLCNDAEGKGVEIDGTKDFYFVVEPRTYANGIRLTITTNDHRMMTVKTSGSTTVNVGELVSMQPVEVSFDKNQIFAENFDVCVWGGDPVGKSIGYQGWRCLLPRANSKFNGTFGTFKYSGIERGHWYSDKVDITDEKGNAYTVLIPGSDLYANYTSYVTSSDYHGMEDCTSTEKMSESFFKYRGLWDWYFSRTIEYHGYLMVGRSQYFSKHTASSGITATGSPQGGLHTPQLTNIPEGESCNVKLTFKVAKDYCNDYQPLRVTVLGAGAIHSMECGNLTTQIDAAAANVGYIKNFGDLPYTWMTCEVVIKGATNKTFIQIFSPDGKDAAQKNYKTTTYFVDDIMVEKTSIEPGEKKIKMGFLGDSITTFAGWSEGGSNFYPFYGELPDYPQTLTDVKDTYWYKIVFNLMSNAELDKVLAYGGTTVVNNGKNPRTDFLFRCSNFVNPDVIVIHGGTNDKNQDIEVGSYDYDLDEDQLDETKYRSAYIKLIKKLNRLYPNAQLLIIIGDMLTEPYYTSTEAIATHFGIPYVSFTGVYIPKVKGSHPNAAGMNTIANNSYNAFKKYLN